MKINPDIELLDGGRKLPLVEDFYTIQGEGYTPASLHTLYASVVAT